MKIKYLIMSPSWEYNDEYNYKLGDDIGTPMMLCNNEKEANALCEQYEIKWWQDYMSDKNIGGWMSHGESYESLTGLMECQAISMLSKVFTFGNPIKLLDWVLPRNLTVEQVKVLKEVYPSIYFYFVTEVKVNEQ